jgi:hypothetical protein
MIHPYAPPGAASTADDADRSIDDVRRGALLVVVLDAARSLLWRGVSSVALAYPAASPSLFGIRAANIFIKLVGAGGILFAVRLLTRPSRAGVSVPGAGLARTCAAIAVAAHALRLVLALSSAEAAVSWLEGLTTLLDGIMICSAAFCLGSFFAAARIPEPPLSARVLGVMYLAATTGGAWVSAVTIPHFPRELAAGSGFRSFLSLFFIGLAISAFPLIRRLRSGAS